MFREIKKFKEIKEEELHNVSSLLLNLCTPLIEKRGVQVGLEGDLGAGKTRFVTSLLRETGSSTFVSSPTYVLENIYPGGNGISEISHWDLYRIKGELPEELLFPPRKETIRIIEWADLFPELDELIDFKISIEYVDDSLRSFTISGRQ